MTEVGVREFKARLSEYLRRVKAGEVIVITERGKPIGEVVPRRRHRDDALRRLLAEGKATWSGRTPELPPPIVTLPGTLAAGLIIEERNEGL